MSHLATPNRHSRGGSGVSTGSGAGIRSKEPCKRPKCNRTKDLNENGICGGHACAYPNYICKETKSSSDELCEGHKRMAGAALPKNWARVLVGKVHMFLNIKDQVAQYNHPGSNLAQVQPRMSRIPIAKPKKGVPTHFVIAPQPPDLDDPWELVLAVPDPGKSKNYATMGGAGSVFLYFNSADHTIQFSDPRPAKTDPKDTLPAGWEQAFDADGDPYYINVDTGIRSYDDPRIVVEPMPSRSLSQESSQRGLKGPAPSAPKIELKRDKKFTFDSLYEDPREMSNKDGGEEQKMVSEEPLPAIPPKPQRRVSKDMVRSDKPQKPAKDAVWQIGACDMFGYEMLDDCLTFEDEIPQAARNKQHNRYMDILPNPKTRVPLPIIDNDPESGYVNANYVIGPNSDPKYYIASMGPLPKTINNFWRMLWQEKPLVIVMVTGLVEKGVPKCERYWPGLADGKSMMSFGDVRVVNLQSSPKRGYVRSTLKAVSFESGRSGKRVSHTIEHFWYNTWPDHGVPRNAKNPLYTDDVLEMLAEINTYVSKKKQSGKSGPVLMHCSAGIGRTGTCIAIDHCMYHLVNSSFCDPLRTTAAIRQFRCALVQHPQQFKFVHAASVRFAERANHDYDIQNDGDRMDSLVKNMDSAAQEQLRKEEKEAARARSHTMSTVGDKGRDFMKQTFSQAAGELSMGSIEYEGKHYYFVDPDGNGSMDIQEAVGAGFPRALFKKLDGDNDGTVTPAEFKKYQRLQRQKAAKARADAAARQERPIVGSPQSVQQRMMNHRQGSGNAGMRHQRPGSGNTMNQRQGSANRSGVLGGPPAAQRLAAQRMSTDKAPPQQRRPVSPQFRGSPATSPRTSTQSNPFASPVREISVASGDTAADGDSDEELEC